MTDCSLCAEPTDTDPCPDCLELFDLGSTETVTEEPMPWLAPTDGAEVVTEARKSIVKLVTDVVPAATITLRIVAPPTQGPTPPPPPGVLPPLEFEPCDCEPGCTRQRVVGTRLCHPCKCTFRPESYDDHLMYRSHLKNIGDPNWEAAADGHPVWVWGSAPVHQVDHGPCHRCGTGRLIQFAGLIDAVCAPADPDARCPVCRDLVGGCVTDPPFQHHHDCGWRTWSPCGLWVAGTSRTKTHINRWATEYPATEGANA